MRILGAFFVVFYGSERLPAPFAPSAGWGDIIVGITALPVAFSSTRSREWRRTSRSRSCSARPGAREPYRLHRKTP